jgi:hypothetical protein
MNHVNQSGRHLDHREKRSDHVFGNIRRALTVAVAFWLIGGIAGAQDEPSDSLAGTQNNPLDSAAAIETLRQLSDSLRFEVGKALKDRNIEVLQAAFPDDLGIVLAGGKAVYGHDATHKYGELLMDTFGGGELKAKRERSGWMGNTDGYAHELFAYDFRRMAADSTAQRWTGHMTVYWQWQEGQWHLKRLFLSER